MSSYPYALTIAKTAVTLGATMRLQRFITQDDLAAMLIQEPADAALDSLKNRADELDDPMLAISLAHLSRLRDGLKCPWCVGFWLGLLVIGTGRVKALERLWWPVAGALALNHVATHLGIQLADYGYDDDEEN